MKVKELIELLKALPENQDVLMYNGYTQDWHEIEISQDTLSRLKTDKLKEFIVMEDYRSSGKPFPDPYTLKKEVSKVKVKPHDWSFNDYAINPDLYTYKNISLIQGKKRNKSCFDRMGSIQY